MKKLLFLFLLLPITILAQVSTGQEQDFDYGLRNLAPQSVSTPVYICTQGLDGTIGITAGANIEKTANKQNSLNYDGTATKYPTVDGVNDWTRQMATVATKTGLLSKNDTFNLIPLTNSTLRISAVTSGMFWDEIFVPSTAPSSAIKSFAQKDYDLTQLVTATGGNVNANPITTDGKHVRYLAYDKNGNVYSSASNFLANTALLQLGFVTVLKTGATVEFLDGTAGPRHVLAQPALASNTEFDKVAATITTVAVGRKSNASFSTTNGTITGISVNWKSAANPTNSDPIDVFNYTGQTTASFVVIDPTFLTSTSAITTHTLLTELDEGIAVNESFYNTTTGLRGTMANGSAAVARIMVGVRGGIFWQMGEFSSTACYADLATAKSNIYSHVFSEAIVPPGVAYEIARVAFTKGVTVTNNDTQFYLVNTGGGSGGSTTIPPVSDATTATKGILKLAGSFDATSTADVPIIKSASASQDGLVTTGTQTISGAKTFTSTVTASNGSVLIGTTSDLGSRLLVVGDTAAKNTIQQFYSGIAASKIRISDDGAYTFSLDGDVGNTERMRISNAGNLLVGTNTDNGVDKLQVNGSILSTAFKKVGGLSTEFLKADGSVDSNAYAPTVSPAFTGTPTAPTATAGTNTTQIATTAFVQNTVSSGNYTPTLTPQTNVSSVTLQSATYTKVGNIVTGRISFVFSPTANGACEIRFTLPVSRTSTAQQNIGTGTSNRGDLVTFYTHQVQFVSASTTEGVTWFQVTNFAAGSNGAITFQYDITQ